MIRYSSYSRTNYRLTPSKTTGLSAKVKDGSCHSQEGRTNGAPAAPSTATTANNLGTDRTDGQPAAQLARWYDEANQRACVAYLIDPLELQYRELQELRERVRAAEAAVVNGRARSSHE
jgi:hypothetical protein